MTGKQRSNEGRFTPEKAHAWTIALYPAAVLLGVAYLLVTNREITTDIIGLFIGLLTAGSLQAIVKKNGGKDGESYSDRDSNSTIHRPSREVLEDDDRGGTNNFDRWRDLSDGLFGRKTPRLSTAG